MVIRNLDDTQERLSSLCSHLDDEPPLVVQTHGVLPLPVTHELFVLEAFEGAEILRIGGGIDGRHDLEERVHHRTREFAGSLFLQVQGFQLLALELEAQTNPLPSTTEAPELFTPGVNDTVANKGGYAKTIHPRGERL